MLNTFLTMSPTYSSLLLATAVASSYVAAIKIREPLHLKVLDRNHPDVIWYRMRRITTYCVIVVSVLPLVLSYGLHLYPDYTSALRQLGLVPGFTNSRSLLKDLTAIVVSALKMAILYVGPLLLCFARGAEVELDLWSFRDHVYAPVTEELIYRGAVVAILQPVIPDSLMWSPLLFGFAHVHHGYTLYRDNVQILAVLATVLFQFAYTSLFGSLANHFYLTSDESLWAPIVVHGICNALGFPSFDVVGPWQWGYYGLLAAGAYGFCKVL